MKQNLLMSFMVLLISCGGASGSGESANSSQANDAFGAAVSKCKLETPIDLRGLEFKNGREGFTRTSSSPDIRTLMSQESARFFDLPSVFFLTKMDSPGGKFLGARIALGDTIHAFGVSDSYLGFKVESAIEKSAEGETHIIKASSQSDTDGWKNYFLDDMSVVRIVDQQIVSVELTEGFWTYNPATKKYDHSTKMTCVTEAAR